MIFRPFFASALIPMVLFQYAVAAPASQFPDNIQLAKQLESYMKCSSAGWHPEGSCHLEFEGLHLETANSIPAGIPNLYVYSLGKGQYLLARGRRCLQIFFKNDSKKTSEEFLMDASVVIHGSGRIWPNLNAELQRICEME